MRTILAAVAALALLAGCGGDEAESDAYKSCKARMENTARAEVVRLAYEQGRLGTQAEIEADMPGGRAIFDDQGHMLPYDELKGLTQGRFDEWVANDDYLAGPVQREAYAAADRVADEGWPDCDDA